jgi:SAM-dependent methyltransferase
MSVTISKAIADNYTEYYRRDKFHSEWRSLGAIDKCANIQQLCASVPHENVVEIGCGDGALIERLSLFGFAPRFAGLEISSTALERARQKHLTGVDFKLFDGYATRLADGQFDLAILSHVIEHVEHPRQLLYEALRVAKTVFVEVPLEDTLRLPRDFVFNSTGHINFYNVATIRSLVQSCGARILAARLSHSSRSTYEYRLGRIKGRLAHGLKEVGRYMSAIVPRFLTYHYALTCQRCED